MPRQQPGGDLTQVKNARFGTADHRPPHQDTRGVRSPVARTLDVIGGSDEETGRRPTTWPCGHPTV
ncbi:hypothetical protein [Actinoallomurus oryzae]|uniref:hypothetical protein n=1 Tax=Actinoallomurus oryzae TaxID=502180 RepID=UPI0031EAFA91